MTRPPSRGDEPHLTNLALPFPPRPVLLAQPHEAPRSFERLVSRLHLEHGVAADDLLGSLKGPSVTLSFPPETRRCAPVELADSPPVWIREPSRRESSVSLAMASMSACGGGPWFSADFTIERNRMAYLPAAFWISGGKSDNSCTWRTSMISPSSMGARLAHSMASSRDFTWITQ